MHVLYASELVFFCSYCYSLLFVRVFEIHITFSNETIYVLLAVGIIFHSYTEKILLSNGYSPTHVLLICSEYNTGMFQL